MPPLTPQITLEATLQDISGNTAGTPANPAKMRIALAGFGLTLPCIVGTSSLVRVGPKDYLDTGAGATAELWGNDVITPAGTYYAITLLDGDGNILQCGAYRFSGTATIDLSDAEQIIPGAAPIGVYVVPIINCGQVVFDGKKGTGQSLTLTMNVTSSSAQNFTSGTVVPFFIKQDATGGRTFAWPANFIGPPAINMNPNGVTTSMWYLGSDGNYHLYREALLIDPVAPSTTRVQPFAAVAPLGIDLGGLNAVQVTAATAVLDGLKGRTQVLPLTEDVTIAGADNFTTGNLVTLVVSQDPTGGWTLTWASEFQSPPMINMGAFGKTIVMWADDEFGNYYQFGVAIWA